LLAGVRSAGLREPLCLRAFLWAHRGHSHIGFGLRRSVQPAAIASARFPKPDPQSNQAVRGSLRCAVPSQASSSASRPPIWNDFKPTMAPRRWRAPSSRFPFEVHVTTVTKRVFKILRPNAGRDTITTKSNFRKEQSGNLEMPLEDNKEPRQSDGARNAFKSGASGGYYFVQWEGGAWNSHRCSPVPICTGTIGFVVGKMGLVQVRLHDACSN
jgi:hypothetical protein